MRIGQFTDTFIPVNDGVGRVALAYAETLAKMEHQVTVVSPMYDTGFRGGYPFELVDFTAVTVPGMKQYKTGEAPWDPHYRKRIRSVKLDIIHAHSPFMAGSEALRLASVRDLPLVATFHSQYYDDFYKVTGSRQLAKLGSKFVVDFYSRCDEVWAVGDKTAEVLHRYGYKGEVIVMPNGTFIRPVREEDKLRAAQAYDLRDDIPVLLFVGQMNWKKNILRILEACALLRKEAFAFKLVLAGQGPDNAKIKEKIHQFDLDSHVCLTGHITDIHLLDGLYQCADLFVFPSLYDAAPMVVREAAAMGTPAVMVEGSCAAEVIQDRDNGFLCKDDPESLRNVIKEALSDQDALKRVAERSRKTIPILWDEIIKCAALRYEALIERNRQGLCKKKNLRII